MSNIRSMAQLPSFTLFLLVLITLVATGGCSTAKKSTEVQAARAPVAPYLRMKCDELATEQRVLQERVDMTRKAVDTSHSSDKTTELVTWLLFAPAAFMLEGNQQQATDFAVAKGQYDSVQEAMNINKCLMQGATTPSDPAKTEEKTPEVGKS